MPLATNCSVTPTGILGLAGVTTMEERVAEFTVRFVFPEIAPELAVTVVAPGAVAVAKPLLLIAPMDGFDELQLT